MISETDSKLGFVDIKNACEPKNGLHNVYVDHWWIVHPTKGLVFYKSYKYASSNPQCNQNKKICQQMQRQFYPWAKIQKIGLVYSPANPSRF